MPSVDLTAVGVTLKKDILPTVVDAIKQDTLLYNIAKRSFKPQKFINNKFYVPVKLGMSSGFTSWGTSGTPTVNKGAIKPVEASFELTQATGSFSIDKITLDSGKGAVVDSLTLQAEGVKDIIARMLNYTLWRAGGDHLFLANGAGSTATTLVIDEGRTVTNGDIDYARYLPVGASIKIGTAGPVTVTAHSAKNTVTLSAALTWNDNDPVYILDGDGAKQTYLNGLLSVIGTGVYGGIDPATYADWQSYVSAPGSTALALADVDKAHVEANQYGKVQYTFANKTLYEKYISLLTANRHVVATEKPVFHGGWTGIDYMGHQIVLDYDTPDDCVFHISPKDLAIGTLTPFSFLPGENGTLFKAYGKTEWEAIMYGSQQLVGYRRNSQAVLEDRTA